MLAAEAFGVVGATELGDLIGVELRLSGGELATVMFPASLYPKLMAGLMAAGAAAHSAKLAYLGSEQAILDLEGVEAFSPSGFRVSHTRTQAGEPVVLVRLEKADAPVVDLALSPEMADELARAVSSGLARPPAPRRPRQ